MEFYNSKKYGYKVTYLNEEGKKRNTVCWTKWQNMKNRVLSLYEDFDSYSKTSIHKDWYDFQNFGYFFYTDKYRKDFWHLDKDLLSGEDKIYGPETCCFLPQQLNVALVKEKYKKDSKLPGGIHFRTDKGGQGYYQVSCSTGKRSNYLKSTLDLEEALMIYKIAKEARIKELAQIWKYQIDPRAYEALMIWKV